MKSTGLEGVCPVGCIIVVPVNVPVVIVAKLLDGRPTTALIGLRMAMESCCFQWDANDLLKQGFLMLASRAAKAN